MRANAKVAAVAAVAAFFAFVGLAPQGASAPLAVTVTVPPLPVTTSVPPLPVTTTAPPLPVTTTVPPLPVTTTVVTTTTTRSSSTTASTTVGSDQSPGGTTTTKTTTIGVGADGASPRCRSRRGLPDRRCTGGAARRVTARQVCGRKRAQTAPPSARMVDNVFAAYGIAFGSRSRYRIDHLISVELGGSSVAANLWPQPKSGSLNAGQKDRVEAYLLRRVCGRKLGLRSAQTKLARNWVAAYRAMRSRARRAG
jgi:hypothetical protein